MFAISSKVKGPSSHDSKILLYISFLRNSGSYTWSSIVYESKDLRSLSKLVHLQKTLNTSDPKSALKYGLLIAPGRKKKNSFLSMILIRPSKNLSTLPETIQYINIHLSSTVTPTSIIRDTPTSLCSLFSAFCFSQHVSVSHITMFRPSLLLRTPPQTCSYFSHSPVAQSYSRSWSCSPTIQTWGRKVKWLQCLLLNDLLSSLGLYLIYM